MPNNKKLSPFYGEFSPFTKEATPKIVQPEKPLVGAEKFYKALAALFGHEKTDPFIEAQVHDEALSFDEQVDRNCGLILGK